MLADLPVFAYLQLIFHHRKCALWQSHRVFKAFDRAVHEEPVREFPDASPSYLIDWIPLGCNKFAGWSAFIEWSVKMFGLSLLNDGVARATTVRMVNA